jgi:hypothetical protein
VGNTSTLLIQQRMDSLNMSTFSPPPASPLLLVFKSDRGHFLGLLDNQRLQDLIASTSLQTTSSTLSPEELEVEMLDQQQIPQYRVKLRVTFHFSQVTKAQMIRQNQQHQMVVSAKAVELVLMN